MFTAVLLYAVLLPNGVTRPAGLPDAVSRPAECEVDFADADRGWLTCGLSGPSYRTGDGGRSWQRLAWPGKGRVDPHSPGPAPPLRYQLRAGGHGWAAIDETVYLTSDAGLSWKRLCSIPVGPALKDGRLEWLTVGSDESTVLARVSTPDGPGRFADQLLVSQDAGKTWEKRPLPSGKFEIIQEGRGSVFFLFGKTAAMYSKDKGRTWADSQFSFAGGHSEHFLGSAQPPLSVVFAGEFHWLLQGEHLFRSDDQGRSWFELARPTQIWPRTAGPGHQRIQFLTVDHGYAVGRDGVLRESDDGGFQWTAIPMAGDRVVSFSCFDVTTCYAITQGRGLLRVEAMGMGGR